MRMLRFAQYKNTAWYGIFLRFCLASFGILALTMDWEQPGWSNALNGWGIEKCLLIVLLYFVFARIKEDHQSKAYSILSVLFTVCTLWGICYSKSFSTGYMFTGPYYPHFLLSAVGYFVVYRVAIQLFVRWITSLYCINDNSENEAISSKRYAFRISLTLCCCWLPYFIALLPGTVLFDTGTSLQQYFGLLPLRDDNPIFQTFLVGAFVNFGKLLGNPSVGLILFLIVQIFSFIALITYMLILLLKNSASRTIRKIILIFYALNPVFPLYAITACKDVNFGIVVTWLAVSLYEIVLDANAFFENLAKVVSLTVCLVLCFLLRNAGAFLVIACVPMLILLAKKHRKKVSIICGSVVLAMLVFKYLLIPAMGILPEWETANISIPLQTTARYVLYHPSDVTEEERKIISRVLDYDKIAEMYNLEISDPIKNIFNYDATEVDIENYYKVWLRQGMRHPLCYFDAIMNKSYGYLYPNHIDGVKPYVFVGISSRVNPLSSERVILASYFPEVIEFAEKVVWQIRKLPLISLVFSPGFYAWCIFLFFTMCTDKMKRRYLFVMVPALFVLIGCFASPVNGYFRYALPMVFCVPFLFGIAATATKEIER